MIKQSSLGVLILLNETGFQRQTYSELLDGMEDKAKELFGEDINTSSKTPLGIILRIFAWFWREFGTLQSGFIIAALSVNRRAFSWTGWEVISV